MRLPRARIPRGRPNEWLDRVSLELVRICVFPFPPPLSLPLYLNSNLNRELGDYITENNRMTQTKTHTSLAHYLEGHRWSPCPAVTRLSHLEAPRRANRLLVSLN